MVLLVNMHLIKGTWMYFPCDFAGYRAISMVHWYQWYDWWARNATIVVKKVNSRRLAFTWVQAHIAVNSESVDIINYYIQ